MAAYDFADFVSPTSHPGEHLREEFLPGYHLTAGALAEDLSRFIEDRPIRARRVSTSERAWRWSKRNPWLAGLSAALLLSLVGGTIVASFLAARPIARSHGYNCGWLR